MIVMTLLATAAVAIAPEQWVSASDWPPKIMLKGVVAAVGSRVLIDETGRPVHCRPTLPGSDTDFNRAACRIIMQRARFSPARDDAGVPILADTIVDMEFTAEGSRSPCGDAAHKTDAIVQVSSVPAEARRPAFVDVAQVVRVDGSSESCDVVRSSGSKSLDRLACPALMIEKSEPLRDERGNPVRAFREKTIAFAVAP